MISDTRTQHGQEFRKAGPHEIHVGQCVWITAYDPNVGRSWLEGPYFVVEIIHEGRMSQHLKLFSTHEQQEISSRISDIFVPIIDKITPPRGHNA